MGVRTRSHCSPALCQSQHDLSKSTMDLSPHCPLEPRGGRLDMALRPTTPSCPPSREWSTPRRGSSSRVEWRQTQGELGIAAQLVATCCTCDAQPCSRL